MIPVPAKKNSKILSLEELAQLTASLRAQGKTVVHCHGVFDLMHIGHIRHFEQAKQLGDVLVVTVTPDCYVNKGPNRPVFTETHRAWAIAALSSVDYVAINRWPMAIDTIKFLKPSIYVKGNEFRDGKDRTGAISQEAEAIEAVGGRMAFTGDIVFSSSSLLNRYFGVLSEQAQAFLTAFCTRHSSDDVLRYLEETRRLKVLVLGEAIIDEYTYCETLGKSGKEPILAARYINSERFPGGILAVANHVTAVSDRVTMLTCLGEVCTEEDFVREHTKAAVEKLFLYVPNTPTIVKRRFLESYPLQKLFELYVMSDFECWTAKSAELSRRLNDILPEFDLVIVADYGHGMITPEVAAVLSSEARFLAINTQVNAGNQGFNTVSKYQRADYICISERELRLEVRRPRGDLRQIVHDVSAKLSCDRLLITRGNLGCLCYERSEGFVEVPAFSGQVVDRVGAGDAVLAITATCAAQQTPMDVIGFVGNCVGLQAVGTVGNKSFIERVPLARYIECLLK
jgi:rfaE bifunctional protein kinase chain/domain/rfaE bifunctional protein nucleotidyltransferase chain/domain